MTASAFVSVCAECAKTFGRETEEAALKSLRAHRSKTGHKGGFDLEVRGAPGTCRCGCGGEPKGKTSAFLPGHDARIKTIAVEIDEIVRHVKTKETGATVIVQKVGPGSTVEQNPGWMTQCLNHGQLVFHSSRLVATRHSAQPSGWCSDCEKIVSGKAPKIEGAKLR